MFISQFHLTTFFDTSRIITFYRASIPQKLISFFFLSKAGQFILSKSSKD